METLFRQLLAGAVGTRDKPTPWPSGLVVAGLAVLVLAVLCVVGVMQRRGAAAALHRIDVIENDLRQAGVLETTHQNARQREQLERQVVGLEAERHRLRRKLGDLNIQRLDLARQVELVTSWDQL